MKLHGPTGLHNTQLSGTASYLRRGMSVESVVQQWVEHTQNAVEGDPEAAKWSWAKERTDIERECFDWIKKNPELSSSLPDHLQGPFNRLHRDGRSPYFALSNGKWEVRARDALAEDTSESGPRIRFKLHAFADIHLGQEQPYYVDELIPKGAIVVIWGRPKCLKSFWTLDLCMHVASGWEYRDRYTEQATVVYCAFEGAHGFKKRIAALRVKYGLTSDHAAPFFLMAAQTNLIQDSKLLIADIAYQLGEQKPGIVVLDTLNKSLFGSESKDEDMGSYLRAAEAIKDRFGCSVIIVHHCGHDDTRPRGHSSLPGGLDTQIAIKRTESIVTATVEMMRDGPEDTQITSAAEVVDVGMDQAGKIISSLVIVPTDEAPVGVNRGWPKALAILAEAIGKAIRDHGEDFEPDEGGVVRAVDHNWARDAFLKVYVGDAQDTATSRDRMAWKRGLKQAQENGLVKVQRSATGRLLLWLAR
jgi:hypothetical protein